MVAVEVVEAPPVHEAVVLRVHGVLPTSGDGFLHHLVHFGPAIAREREEPLRVLGRVAELLLGERPEEGFAEEHDEGLLADDHAGGLVVGELRVELEAELREEVHRLLQIADGQVDEELSGTLLCHDSSLGRKVALHLGARIGRTARSRSSRSHSPAQRNVAT